MRLAFGSWTLIQTDSLGKRALCRCICGAVREVSIEALESGVSRGCGCSARDASPGAAGQATFAATAAAEQFVARGRRRGST
jgi:hypothetical protein